MERRLTTEVVVVGGGPAGYACALRLSDHGLAVTLVEAGSVGGTCLHRGCIPSRAMLEAAQIIDTVSTRAERWGIHTLVEKVDFPRLIMARDELVRRNHIALQRHLERSEVQMIRGWARLRDERSIAVDRNIIRADRALVIATGSKPRSFERFSGAGSSLITSDEALQLDAAPASALILGGGAIGIEFAQIWRALGTEVTILEREEHLIPAEDGDVGRYLALALTKRGIRIVTAMHVEEVHGTSAGVSVRITRRDGTEEEHQAEVMLVAAGRTPETSSIGLEEAGIELIDGYIRTNEVFETSASGVYAVGDVLGPPALGRANAAFAEGLIAADAIAGISPLPLDYDQIPRVTHGIIETACVGLSEARAEEEGLRPKSKTLVSSALAKGAILGETGITKIVMDRDGIVVGVHLVGPNATELIGEAVALTSFQASVHEGATLAHPHPALSESLQELNLALAGRPLHVR